MSGLICSFFSLFAEKTEIAGKLTVSGMNRTVLLLILGTFFVLLGIKLYRFVNCVSVFCGTAIVLCTLMVGRYSWGTVVTAFTVLGFLLGATIYCRKLFGAVVFAVLTAACIAWSLYPVWWCACIAGALAGTSAALFPLAGITFFTSLMGGVLIMEQLRSVISYPLLILITAAGTSFQLLLFGRKQTLFTHTMPDRLSAWLRRRKSAAVQPAVRCKASDPAFVFPQRMPVPPVSASAISEKNTEADENAAPPAEPVSTPDAPPAVFPKELCESRAVFRKEIKYILPRRDALAIQNTLDKIMSRDANGINGSYRIRSQYYDSVYDRDLADNLAGLYEKRKIRLRIYSPEDRAAKLEYKCKNGADGVKYSLNVSREEAMRMERGDFSFLLERSEALAIRLYMRLTEGAYTPKSIIEYQRLAFLYPAGDVRITFDTDIRGSGYPYGLFGDICTFPLSDSEQVLMEVKYTGYLPDELRRVLNAVDDLSTANSKYSAARLTCT